MAAVFGTGSDTMVYLSTYGYYNDARGYQEAQGVMIAVPIA